MAKKNGFIKEFKEFISRGSVIDLAVGVIIGGAFQKIVNSLVNDIIMPVISLVTGGIDFNNWFLPRQGRFCHGGGRESRRCSHLELRYFYRHRA